MLPFELKDDPKVLITRLSHLGDCLLTVPVANAIRDRFPKATIVWVVEPPGNQIVSACPSVDEVITVPKGWLKKPVRTWQLRQKLKRFQFDYSIDPQSLTKSAGIAWISGCTKRLGLARPIGRELAPWMNNYRILPERKHVVDRSLEILKLLGISNASPRFDLNLPESAVRRGKEIINQIGGAEQRFAIINPGAGWKSRQWCNQRFGQVAKHLASNRDLLPLVTWFGEDEERMADEIVAASSHMAIKAPPTRIWELGALLRQARFLIGCDTGPTHLAAAMGVPCVTLFGTTEPEVSGPYEPDSANPVHVRIQKYYQAGSSRERRKASNHAMLEIQVSDVIQGIEQLIQRLDQNPAGMHPTQAA